MALGVCLCGRGVDRVQGACAADRGEQTAGFSLDVSRSPVGGALTHESGGMVTSMSCGDASVDPAVSLRARCVTSVWFAA